MFSWWRFSNCVCNSSLDFESSRLCWIVALLGLVDEQLLVQPWHSQFLSLHINLLTARRLHLIFPIFVLTQHESVEIHQIDLHDDDDNEINLEDHF